MKSILKTLFLGSLFVCLALGMEYYVKEVLPIRPDVIDQKLDSVIFALSARGQIYEPVSKEIRIQKDTYNGRMATYFTIEIKGKSGEKYIYTGTALNLGTWKVSDETLRSEKFDNE